jgi:hypothetical protein
LEHHLTIAGARFVLNGALDLQQLPSSFTPFLDTAADFDVQCAVNLLGPSDAVSTLPLVVDDPWSFRVNAGRIDVCRRNEAGATLWRIRGSLSMDEAEVSWHPTLFTKHYESYEKAWETGLGLSILVLLTRDAGGLLFHGSATTLDGMGVLCVGVSGRGKSTIATLFDTGDGVALTDEHPVVRQSTSRDGEMAFQVHGSPWPSSAGYARDDAAPLKRIYFLEHGPENVIHPLSPSEAFQRLIKVALIPWQDPQLFDPCLSTVEALLANVPAAVLSFVPDESVVDAIRQDLASERVIV